jgi:hypothetical protein
MHDRIAGPAAVLLLAAVLGAAILAAQGHDVVIPYIPPPQDNSALHDPVTNLARRIEAGSTRLTTAPVGGALPALLRELNIPVSSQVLVFSKTSLQHEYITPRTPRAIYFNDDTYVGFVPDGPILEVSTVDPEIGAVFYTVGHRTGARPILVTDERCLQCHQIPATFGIAGHMMRSTFVRSDGTLASGEPSYLTDDTSPIEERWGGWFVSGTVGGAMHMGNSPLPQSEHAATFDRSRGTAITDVARLFSEDRYLSPHSDVVALMVLGHQTRMHNLIARLHHLASSRGSAATTESAELKPGPGDAAVTTAIDDLVRYLLFADEASLKGPVVGTSTFAADFEKLGPKDGRGRSLRQFDLQTRMFRYPCSYLIYSEAFLALPADIKSAIYSRLDGILTGRDGDASFGRLSSADRTAILEILTATHSEFAAAVRPS